MNTSTWIIFALVALGVGSGVGCASGGKNDEVSVLTSGVYLQNRDTSVKPQDDFFHYVNGGWLARNDIPSDKSQYGSFEQLGEEADENVRGIIERAAESGADSETPEGRIATLYISFMAEEHINSIGISPLQTRLKKIDDISSQSELLSYFAEANYAGVNSPFEIAVHNDFIEPERYRVYLLQSGLGLPNSDFYQDESEKGRAIISAYQNYVRELYLRLGYSAENAERATATSWNLESALASHHRPVGQNRDYTLWHNLYGPGQKDLPSGVGWSSYLSMFQLSAETVISLAQPEYFDGFGQIVLQTPLAVWRDYLKLRLVSSSAKYLGQDLQDLSFNFYSTTLLGTPEMKPRWQRGVNFVNGAVGESVGEIYVREQFPAEAKARMNEMVQNLVLAFRDSIESLDWMGEETRANALAKLEKFNSNIGYPDKWKDYSTMQLGAELLPNVREANRWSLAQEFAKLGKPVDKREWSMNPQTVNAYYSSFQNSINFPAAILQAPFFDSQVDDAVNYGAIGSIIGHEIGHGFDDLGAQFDGDGRLKNWWTDDDRAAFKSRTAILIEQYDQFEILPGVAVNGAFTQSENIGDLAGVSISYKAYIKSLGGNPAPVLDGYTGEQRFFIGFAQAFINKSREERARQMINTDTHSPASFRVNGTLSNIDGFYEAFNLGPEGALYRPVEKRASIW